MSCVEVRSEQHVVGGLSLQKNVPKNMQLLRLKT